MVSQILRARMLLCCLVVKWLWSESVGQDARLVCCPAVQSSVKLHVPLHQQVWVRPTAEMQFLYGNHVLKSGLGRITEGTPAYTGAVHWDSSGFLHSSRDFPTPSQLVC